MSLRVSRGLSLLNSVRTFSAQVQHEPTKKVYGTTGRYANATYIAASKAGILEVVETELRAFSQIMKDKPDFTNFLKNPTIPRSVKAATLNDMLDDRISHITRNLFTTMAANGRIGDAAKVVDSFLELIDSARGLVPAIIITAEPLKKKTIDSIQAAIRSIIGADKQLDITVREDTSILGGLQIQIEDRLIDLSLAGRVEEVRRTLQEVDSFNV